MRRSLWGALLLPWLLLFCHSDSLAARIVVPTPIGGTVGAGGDHILETQAGIRNALNDSSSFCIDLGSHTGQYGRAGVSIDSLTGLTTRLINLSGFADFTLAFSDSGYGRMRVDWIAIDPTDSTMSTAIDTIYLGQTSVINQITRVTLSGAPIIGTIAAPCYGKLWFRSISGTGPSCLETLGPLIATTRTPPALGFDTSDYRRVEMNLYRTLLDQKYVNLDPAINPYTLGYTTDTTTVLRVGGAGAHTITYVTGATLTSPTAVDWGYRKQSVALATGDQDAGSVEAITLATQAGSGANQNAWLATGVHGDVKSDISALMLAGTPTNANTRSGYGRRAVAESEIVFGKDSTAFHSHFNQKTGIGIGYYSTTSPANYGWAPSANRPLMLLYATFNDSLTIGGKWKLFTCPGAGKVGQVITLVGVPTPVPGEIAVSGSTARFNVYRLRLDFDGVNGRVYAYVNGILGAVQSNSTYLPSVNNAEEYGMCLFLQGGNNSTADFQATFTRPRHIIYFPEK